MTGEIRHRTHGLSPSYLQVIGEIVTNWAYIEHELSNILCVMLGVSRPASMVLIPQLSTFGIVHLVKTLLLERFPDIRTQVETIFSEIEKGKVDRDSVAHSPWLSIVDENGNPAQAYLSQKPSRRHNAKEAKPYSVEELKEISTLLRSAYGGLVWLTNTAKPEFRKRVFPLPLLRTEDREPDPSS